MKIKFKWRSRKGDLDRYPVLKTLKGFYDRDISSGDSVKDFFVFLTLVFLFLGVSCLVLYISDNSEFYSKTFSSLNLNYNQSTSSQEVMNITSSIVSPMDLIPRISGIFILIALIVVIAITARSILRATRYSSLTHL